MSNLGRNGVNASFFAMPMRSSEKKINLEFFADNREILS